MTTEQIDNYLLYILATEEAYKIERSEPFPYSEYTDDESESEES